MPNSLTLILRRLIIILFIIFSLGVDVQADITSGLVGYWKLDEGAGVAALDSSSKGNNGTLSNFSVPATSTSGWTNQGARSGALIFDGTDDKVDVGTASVLNITGNFSIAAWVNPVSFGTNSRGRIFDKDNISGAGYGFDVTTNVVSQGLSIFTNGSQTGSSANCITLNVWQHVAVVYDGSHATFYVNGVQKGSPAYSVTPSSAPAISGVIGARSGANDRNFDGRIDDVRVYNRALTASDVYALYLSDNRIRNAVMSNVQFK